MKWKHIIATCVMAAFPSVTSAQKAAKPTKADVEKVVQTISADKGKVKIYCVAQKLGEQMDRLDQKKDAKKLEDLGKQVDALEEKLGPEYIALMKSMEGLSEEGSEELFSAFESLNKMCA